MREIKDHMVFFLLTLSSLRFRGFAAEFLVEKPENDDNLILAHTICRHGERNILYPYPNDPYKSEEYWPGGFGQLNSVGVQHHRELGQYLHKRYEKLLGSDANLSDKVYVESTDTPRTIASAKACLSGLLPTGGDQQPIHVVPKSEDFYMQFTKTCTKYDQFFVEQINPKIQNGLFVEYASLIQYLKENSGENLTTLTDIVYLYDTLDTERSMGLKLPPWAQEIMSSGGPFERLAVNCLVINATTIETIKLTSGYLLKEIFDHGTKKLSSALQPDVSLWMYFAHDFTLTYLLNSLKVFTQHRVPYASCLFLELFQNANDPYIQVYYKNSTQQDIEPLYIPDCGIKCSLSSFYQLYAPILPTQSFDDECVKNNDADWTTVWNENLQNNYGT